MQPYKFFGLPSKEEELSEYQFYAKKLIDYIYRNELSITNDWHRGGSDVADAKLLLKGPVLCRAISERILENTPNFFVAEQEIVKIIVRIKGGDDKFYYLMTLKEQSRRLQFPGGRLRANESPAVALKRELDEEVPECQFKVGVNCVVNPLFLSPMEEILISPAYGVPIKYTIHYYFLHMNDDNHEICTTTNRWVSQDELMKGKTDDGILLMPPPPVVGEVARVLGNNVSSRKVNTKLECLKTPSTAGLEVERQKPKEPSPILVAIVFAILIGVTTASGILAHMYAGDHFTQILAATTILVIIGIVFSLRMANRISARDTTSLLGKLIGKS